MKSQIFHRLQNAPRIGKRDFWLTLLPLLIWLAAVSSRPYVIQARCVQFPEYCAPSSVLSIDQPGLGLDSTHADRFSDTTQTLSGVLAVAVPVAWNAALAVMGTVSPAAAWSGAATDALLVLQSAAWNGAITESTRLVAQRPRPYVYGNPTMGINSSNYTSFYSGHTSFAAAMCMALLLALLGRGAPTLLLLSAGSLAQAMILSTAAFRVLAGRHFLTDVVVGSIAGTLVALAVAYFHRPKIEFSEPVASGLLSTGT